MVAVLLSFANWTGFNMSHMGVVIVGIVVNNADAILHMNFLGGQAVVWEIWRVNQTLGVVPLCWASKFYNARDH